MYKRQIKEFWSRWHISLSSWLRDYIYIPLGGNRVSKARHKLNVLATFLVSGLWHGANSVSYTHLDVYKRQVENLKNNYPMYDYVVINDGSADSTAKICRKYGYELVDLPVNLGLAGAFQTGLKYAYRKGYDYAIQFDADGQHRPEFIAPMLAKIQAGYDRYV